MRKNFSIRHFLVLAFLSLSVISCEKESIEDIENIENAEADTEAVNSQRTVRQRVTLQNTYSKSYAYFVPDQDQVFCNWQGESYELTNAEAFEIIKLGGGKIALKAPNGKYLSSENGLKPMTCNRTRIGSWEQFTYDPVKRTLKGNNGRYVSTDGEAKGMICNRTAARKWESFEIKEFGFPFF